LHVILWIEALVIVFDHVSDRNDETGSEAMLFGLGNYGLKVAVIAWQMLIDGALFATLVQHDRRFAVRAAR
jgi:hypothetical protein